MLTFKNYPPEYKSDFLNEAFATILDDLIAETTPDCWIYGHCNIPEFKIGHTKMLTNQLGGGKGRNPVFSFQI